MSDRRRLGGHLSTPPAAYGADTRADLPFPSGSILAGRAPLERGKIAQAVIDVIALSFFALFICCTALALPVALFLLFFART